VGEQLRVSAVLEGSVRKAGDKLRITAQLINVADGYHLWSETYDGDIKDILGVETDVAQRVVQALKVNLGVEEARALTKKATENPEAHRLYLLGRYHAAKDTQADTAIADRCFEQALQVDPNYALAYCGLADNYGGKGGNTMPGREAWTKYRVLAQKALELDPQLAEAHLALSNVLAGTFDWAGARIELNRALELNPNLAYAYDTAAWILAVFGRSDESIANEKKALELDPLNPLFNGSLGWYLYWARRYDEAITQSRGVIDLFPTDAFSHFVIGCCLFKTGKLADAKVEIEKAIQLDDLPWYTGWLGHTYAVSGDRAKAEQMLHDLDELAKTRYVTPNARVPIYLGLGDKEKTLDELEKCYDDQDGACWWLKVDNVYDGIRNEPRFQALLKKVGLN
jgi:tetratricopeptide (TPR) repeat protein